LASAIDIAQGEKHRLENFHAGIVEVIEVQFGDYLGEDDIIRYDDIYKRA
jgi:mannose-6-phosphate isomerase-like protein (cupin superfamily)